MPKYRNIHTQIVDSDDFNEMPDDFTRLLWVLLFVVLDSEGRGRYSATWVKNKAFPSREDVPVEQVEQALKWYAGRRMIIVYQVDGRQYFWIPTWHKFQRGAEKEAPSVIPPFVEGSEILIPELVGSNSGVTPEEVGSSSGVSPEQVESYSALNTNTNTDSNTNANTGLKLATKKNSSSAEPDQKKSETEGKVSNSRKDPRTEHPAIQVIKRVTGQFPAKGAYDPIIRVLGTTPDEEKFRAVYEAWTSRGYKPTNFDAMLDWYRKGIPAHKSTTGTGGTTALDRSRSAVSKVVEQAGGNGN